MIDPAKVAFFIPGNLKAFKLNLFNRIAARIQSRGGQVFRGDPSPLGRLPADIVPVVGCMPECRMLIDRWRVCPPGGQARPWVYWDRGYNRRIFATDLPTGADGGMYRWSVGAFQMQDIRDVPADRWLATQTPLWPWAKGGRHIVVAEPSPTYQRFHGIEGWTARTVAALKAVTDRPLVIRDKEMQRFGRKLHEDLRGAHCLVTHASNAATEAVIMGCPVFVDPSSAAALVGLTDLGAIETPVYPDREPWAWSIAYCQYTETELVDGTLWKLLA
jgi:hypothetical protein